MMGTVKRKRAKKGAPLPLIHTTAAGIDIGGSSHFVAVPEQMDSEPVREYSCYTCDLRQMSAWLKACGITTVAMESTGVYWIPVFELLDREGFEVLLVNARQVSQVPGRKSDVSDCQWLQKLHSFGLLRGSFRPADEYCEVRGLVRQRGELVRSSARQVQLMQKALTQMNVHLSQVVSDVAGQTGMSIIRAIVAGERDPVRLSGLRDPRCKKSSEEIARALDGNYRVEHIMALSQAVKLWDTYRELMAELEQEIEASAERLLSDVREVEPTELVRSKANKKTDYGFDVQALWYRKSGVDLTRIEGISGTTASVIFSELGLDLSRFRSEKYFTSWLGLCPHHAISGGKVLSRKTLRSANRVANGLRMAAMTVRRSKSWLGAFYRRIASRLGAAKAVTATAHKLAKIVYAMLTKGEEYVARGQQAYEEQFRQQQLQRLEKQAKSLGVQVVMPC